LGSKFKAVVLILAEIVEEAVLQKGSIGIEFFQGGWNLGDVKDSNIASA
jgi:hypothetical protein